MIIVAPTCMHTGSHFVFEYLFGHLPKLNMQFPNYGATDGLYFNHLIDRNIAMFKPLMEKYPVVVPLRHPLVVAASHTAKLRSLDHRQWINLAETVDSFNPYYLPVDRPDRNDYMIALNKGLGTDFPLEWPVYGGRTDTSALRHYDLEPDPHVDKLLENDAVRNLIERIYK